MVNAANNEWVFWLVAGGLGLIGLPLLSWAWLWDRSRGRLRCPKCWYRMEGAPAAPAGVDGEGRATGSCWTCPECGKKTYSERRLRKTRRRKGWAALAVVMLLAGWIAWKAPTATRRGVISYLPTTALVLSREAAYNYGWGGSDIGAELLDRLETGRMNSWQLRWYDRDLYDSVIDNDWWPEVPAGSKMRVDLGNHQLLRDESGLRALIVQARLPDAEPIVGTLSIFDQDDRRLRVWDGRSARWLSITEPESLLEWDAQGGRWRLETWHVAGTPPTGTDEVIFDWRIVRLLGNGPEHKKTETLWSGTRRLPVAVTPVGDDEADAAVRAVEADQAVREGLIRAFGPSEFGLGFSIARPEGEVLEQAVIAAEIALEFEGRVIGRVTVRIGPGDHPDPAQIVPLIPTVTALPAEPMDPRLRLRVRGRAVASRSSSSSDPHWSGEFDMPLSEIFERRQDEDAGS